MANGTQQVTIQVSGYISVRGDLVPGAVAPQGKVAVRCNGKMHFGTLLATERAAA